MFCCSGQIFLQKFPIDYDVFQAFTATVEVKDDGFPVPLTASTTITIMVVNINDPPEFRDDVVPRVKALGYNCIQLMAVPPL